MVVKTIDGIKLSESKLELTENEQTADEAPKDEPRTPWPSVWIVNVISFLINIQFSVFFSSLWPYLSQIDKEATQGFFGWTIAAYSIGQMCASPLFGLWSNRIHQTRLPIATGIVILVAANSLYCSVENFSNNQRFVILAARIFTGIGAGILSVLRSYVATASTLKDRAKAITLATASATLGFIVGPGVQAALGPLDYPGYVAGPFHINMYSSPAYVAIISNLIILALLVLLFKESYAGLLPQKTEQERFFALPNFDVLSTVVLIGSWFAVFFCGVNIETIAAPYSMVMYNWTNKQALVNNGLLLSGSAAVSFVVYLFYVKVLAKRVEERKIIIFSLFLVLLYWIVTWPWPYSEKVDVVKAAEKAEGSEWLGNLTTTLAPKNGSELTGCEEEKYSWCSWMPRVPIYVYLGSFPLMSIGYPAATVAIAILYSKVLGPRPQGVMQGFMATSGGFARTVGPITISYLFQALGPRAAWTASIVVLLGCLFSWLFLYKRVLPLNPRPTLQPGQFFKYKEGFLYRF